MPWHIDGGPAVLTIGECNALWLWLQEKAADAAIAEWKRSLGG